MAKEGRRGGRSWSDESSRPLRQQAEGLLSQSPEKREREELGGPDRESLNRELQTHRIELELQNDQLLAAQAALQEAHDRYLDLYQLAPVGYLTLDRDGVIIEANRRAAELLARPLDQLAGQPLGAFVAQEHQDELFLCQRGLFGGKSRCEVELRLDRQSRAPLWVRAEWILAADSDGSEQIRVTLSDISEQKRLAAQLALADRLSSVGLLAASVGHEINNPLTYALYNLEALAEDLPAFCRRLTSGEHASSSTVAEARVEAEDMCELVRHALDGARRIRQMVKGLRTFTHMGEEESEPLLVHDLLSNALLMTANEITARARLVKSLADTPPVVANEGKLCQVFVNLLVNAAQSIAEGDAGKNAVTVRSWSEGDKVLVAVSDTGSGIPAERLDHIFEPFYTTKRIGEGTGLGLAICSKIVTECGGELSVESSAGQGSTFTVELPTARPAQNDPALRAQDAYRRPGGGGGRGRVLIVDDEDLVRKVVISILNQHEVVETCSGKEAQALLRKDRGFHCILCDLMMPGLSGMDLLDWLQGNYPSLTQRVVFVTGGAFTTRARDYLGRVNNRVLDKPFDVDLLTSTVIEHIAASRADI